MRHLLEELGSEGVDAGATVPVVALVVAGCVSAVAATAVTALCCWGNDDAPRPPPPPPPHDPKAARPPPPGHGPWQGQGQPGPPRNGGGQYPPMPHHRPPPQRQPHSHGPTSGGHPHPNVPSQHHFPPGSFENQPGPDWDRAQPPRGPHHPGQPPRGPPPVLVDAKYPPRGTPSDHRPPPPGGPYYNETPDHAMRESYGRVSSGGYPPGPPPPQPPPGMRRTSNSDGVQQPEMMDTAHSNMSHYTDYAQSNVGDARAASADLCLRNTSVDDCARLLHEICERMGGSIQPQFTLHADSIRKGMNAAVAEVTTRFGTEVTVAFFPDRSRKAKQLKMYERNAMKDFMPVVSEEKNEHLYREGALSVWLPAHIYVDRCTTLKDAMAQCGSPRDALHDLFTICQNLTKQLQMQHRRSICLRDLNSRNIVRANVGTNKSWTLLEYCNTQRAGTKIDSMPAWSCTPELADKRLRGEVVTITTAYDMWQLGTFVYEVATGRPFWPEAFTDAQILHTLATESSKLPHEAKPVGTELVQRILTQLLIRNPAHRLTADALKKLLDKEEETGTLAATINAGYAKTEAPIELPT